MNSKRHGHTQSRKGGYVTLITVIIVLAILGVMSTTLLSFSINSTVSELQRDAESIARYNAHACAETALETIRVDDTTVGAGSAPLDRGSCAYTIIDTGGETRDIQITGQERSATVRMLVEVGEINPQLSVIGWNYVDSF